MMTDAALWSRSIFNPQAVIRARMNGRVLGHCRTRSIVDEGDRIKFYGLSFFLDDVDVTAARVACCSTGEPVEVEIDTPYGAAPGPRALPPVAEACGHPVLASDVRMIRHRGVTSPTPDDIEDPALPYRIMRVERKSPAG